jgi:hypothetical protein
MESSVTERVFGKEEISPTEEGNFLLDFPSLPGPHPRNFEQRQNEF